MKKIFLTGGIYKYMNITLFFLMLVVYVTMNLNYDRLFQDVSIDYIYRIFDGVYHPIMIATKWLAGILGALLFVPAHIFKKWLFYVAPPIMLFTFILVQNISVYSTNILNPTRAKMAENCMLVLAVVTIVFVVVHMLMDRKNKKKLNPAKG